jgi:hypothetical protein
MPTHLTPGVQRLLDQLDGTPVAVYDAGWTLLAWNHLWAALLGDPSTLHGRDRNVLWRHFAGADGRVSHTGAGNAIFEASAVGDLRSATARYPDDGNLRRLVADLRAASTRFAELWDARAVGTHEMDTKPSTTRRWGRSPSTVTCSRPSAATCASSPIPPRPAVMRPTSSGSSP